MHELERNRAGLIYLNPGDVFVSNQQKKVITVLGSCVSLILYAASCHLGGIIHGMYPGKPVKKEDSRYTVISLQMLLREMLNAGVKKQELEAKVFGGGCLGGVNCSESIGAKNAELVFDFLSAEHIQLRVNQTGGNRGQKVIFFTNTGIVYMKYLEQVERRLFLDAAGIIR